MRLFEKDRTFNVLVVGQTQQGKSLFIKKLREIAGCTDEDPAVGHGLSTTSFCTLYPMTLPCSGYKLIEAATGREWLSQQLPKDEVDLFEEFAQREDLSVELDDEFAPHVKLRLIDTPGLDDSEGRDAEHIGNVLNTLSQYATSNDHSLRHISAIMFITKTGAYTDVMQRIFQYYEACMPNLFRGAAVINTAFRPNLWEKKVDQYLKQPKHFHGLGRRRTPRTDIMDARYNAFITAFKHSRRQFFIDSKPAPKRKFEEFLTRETVWDWLQYVMAQEEMPIKEVRLYKFPTWQAIDSVLIEWLGKARVHFEGERERLLKISGSSARIRAICDEKLTKYDAQIQQIDDRLGVINVDTKFILSSKNTTPISGWNTFVGYVSNSVRGGQIKLTHTEVTHFVVDTYDSPSGEWGRTRLDEGTMTWTGDYTIKKGYDNAKLEAKAYTTSSKYYEQEIDNLFKERDSLEMQRSDQQQVAEHIKSTTTEEDSDREVKRLLTFVRHCEAVSDKLSAVEIPLGDKSVSAAMKRYQLPDKTKLTTNDLWRVAILQDREFAMMLGSMPHLFSGNAVPLDMDDEPLEGPDEANDWESLRKSENETHGKSAPEEVTTEENVIKPSGSTMHKETHGQSIPEGTAKEDIVTKPSDSTMRETQPAMKEVGNTHGPTVQVKRVPVSEEATGGSKCCIIL